MVVRYGGFGVFIGVFWFVVISRSLAQDVKSVLVVGEASTSSEGAPSGLTYSEWLGQFLALAGLNEVRVVNVATTDSSLGEARNLIAKYVDAAPTHNRRVILPW